MITFSTVERNVGKISASEIARILSEAQTRLRKISLVNKFWEKTLAGYRTRAYGLN